jgi:nitrile hydratase
MSYHSHADLGGRLGFGAVAPEAEGALWHVPWEPTALALTLAMGATGAWNLDMARAARETLPDYARLSYYRIWLAALERLLIDRGLVQADEIATGRALHAAKPVPRVLAADRVADALARGTPTARAATTAPRFAAGAAVRTRATAVDHHSRLPGYVRGRRGTIERVHGMHVFPDTHAHDQGEQPQWLYTVAFDGTELWPGEAGAPALVSVDAWEPYLEPWHP